MKKIGILLIVLLAVCLAACTQAEMPLKRAEITKIEHNLSKHAQDLVALASNKQGAYWAADGENRYMLALNEPKLSSVEVEMEQDVLLIRFDTNKDDKQKEQDFIEVFLYEVRVPRPVETLRVFKDGEQTVFESVMA